MYGFVVKSVLLGILLTHFLDYRDWLDWQTDLIYKVRPGKCHIVIEGGGSEDMTHIGNGTVLISSGFQLEGISKGYIKALSVSDNTVTTMNISNAPDRSDFLNSPHGLSVWKDPHSGISYLYIISHATVECVEVFEIIDSTEIKYLKTITDASFTFMNDLVVVGLDKFYITKFAQYRENTKYQLEMFSRWRSGKVLFYDGNKARSVMSGLNHPNGINISPDGMMIYLAEWGFKTLRAYSRKSTNNLHETWIYNIESGIDNIEVDPVTGDLWIGSHPIVWRTIDPIGIFGATHAAQVLHVKLVDNAVSEIEEVFADDGDFIAGTSSATVVSGKLVIGTVFDKAAVCEMNAHVDGKESMQTVRLS